MSSPVSSKLSTGIMENFRSDYDTKFTTEISKQMQMPEMLRAVNDPYNAYSQPLNSFPDRLLQNFDMPLYMMDTPRVITLQDEALIGLEDEDADLASDMEDPPESRQLNEFSTPRKGNHLEEADIDVPVTPGSMLLLQNGDEMAMIQRQVAKLTRHVVRLQEDNRRRRNRELILYPVLVGYCLVQLVRMMLRSK